MTPELFWLTLTVILTGLLWVPYILNRITVRGLFAAMGNPSRNDKPHSEWANRLMFAHDNAVENLVIFAPLILILAELDYSSKWTALAAAVYFWARVAHLVVYTLGIPVLRTLSFAAGFAAQVVLVLGIFKIL
ncbi:MAG TPA: MAPEG family protein [Bradyrhizobium sp.]|nr:MAPEG family protein [Bradyrhizobium sp.]